MSANTPSWPGGQSSTDPHEPLRPAGNGMAVAALVLGIAALLLFWTVIGGVLLGLLALILGILAARKARSGRARGRGMAIAGAVTGTLGLLASAVIVIVGVSFLNSDEFDNFQDCVDHADTKADRDDCAQQFENDVNDDK